MNKFNFVKELARRLGCTDTVAKAFVDAYDRLVIDKMCEGEEVSCSTSASSFLTTNHTVQDVTHAMVSTMTFPSAQPSSSRSAQMCWKR